MAGARQAEVTHRLARRASATVRPLEYVARFLSPNLESVDVAHRREMTLAVEVPDDERGPVASGELWAQTTTGS